MNSKQPDRPASPIYRFSALLAAMLLAPAVAWPAALEEVVVTAQKREQSTQDVGISVTAYTGNQLREVGIYESTEIVAMTPGLNYTTPQAEGSQINFFLRGVGLNDFTDANENPVAVYFDETYRGAMGGLSFQLFDIERVEVLRGPQGTLYGRNTTGGLVHYISKRPTEEVEGYGEFGIGDNKQVKLEGAVSGPLADNLFARLSVAANKFDGYVKNRIGPDFSEQDSIAGRLQLLFKINDDSDFLLSGNYSENDAQVGAWQHQATQLTGPGNDISAALPPNVTTTSTCVDPTGAFIPGPGPGLDCLGYRDTDGDPFAGDYDRDGRLKVESKGLSGTLNWGIGDMTLTSITAFQRVDRTQEEDTDAGPAPLEPSFPAVTDQFTQELRLSGGNDNSNWVGGFYYYKNEVEAKYTLDATGLEFVFLDTLAKQDTKSWAIFGQYEFNFSDAWKLSAGIRYNKEEKELDYFGRETSGLFQFLTDVGVIGLSPTRPAADNSFVFNTNTVGDLAKHDEDSVSGRLGLDWTPSEDLLVYASYSRGTKSAGFNTGFLDETFIFASNVPDTVPYGKETLNAYEIGFKSSIMDGAARLNGAVFYYDYKDLQTFRFELLNQVIFNTDGKYWGGELEFIASPAEGLDLVIGAAYLDTEVDNIPSGSGVIRKRTAVSAPDWSINGLLRYQWPAFNGTMAAIGSASYQGETFFDIQNHPISRENGYTLVNARLQWASADEGIVLAAYVNNLTDEEYLVYTFDFTGTFGFNQQGYGRPRWAGASVRFNF